MANYCVGNVRTENYRNLMIVLQVIIDKVADLFLERQTAADIKEA